MFILDPAAILAIAALVTACSTCLVAQAASVSSKRLDAISDYRPRDIRCGSTAARAGVSSSSIRSSL